MPMEYALMGVQVIAVLFGLGVLAWALASRRSYERERKARSHTRAHDGAGSDGEHPRGNGG